MISASTTSSTPSIYIGSTHGTRKYPGIKTEPQYRACCQLEALVAEPNPSAATQEAIDLLTRLIETWNRAHATRPETDPLELLRSLRAGRQLLAKNLANVLNTGKGTVSDVLNRRRGLSREIVRRRSLKRRGKAPNWLRGSEGRASTSS